MCFDAVVKAVSRIFKATKVDIDKGPPAAELEAQREKEAETAKQEELERAAAAYGQDKQFRMYTGKLGIPNRMKKL
jgi:hypothetical protein